jgi:glucose dehydrogenase
MSTLQKVETTPLVVDGVMYVTQPPNDVIALDPETGRQYWSHIRSLPAKIDICCGQVNRGLAILGNRLYMGTVDAHLVALDAKTGNVIWDIEEADHAKGVVVRNVEKIPQSRHSACRRRGADSSAPRLFNDVGLGLPVLLSEYIRHIRQHFPSSPG